MLVERIYKSIFVLWKTLAVKTNQDFSLTHERYRLHVNATGLVYLVDIKKIVCCNHLELLHFFIRCLHSPNQVLMHVVTHVLHQTVVTMLEVHNDGRHQNT